MHIQYSIVTPPQAYKRMKAYQEYLTTIWITGTVTMRFRCLLFERNVEIKSFLCFVLIPEDTFFSKVKPFFGSSQSRETVPLIFNISLWHFSPRLNHFLLSSVSWDSPFNHQHFSLWPGGKDDPVDEPEEEEVDGAEQQDLLHVPVHRLIRKTTSRLLL